MVNKNVICGIYARLDVNDKRAFNLQIYTLEKTASSMGWRVYGIYKDLGQKGHGGLALRPGLRRMMNDAREEKFNVVLRMSPDRVAKNSSEETFIKHLLMGVDEVLVYHEDAK